MKSKIYRTVSVHFTLLILFVVNSGVECRQWQSIVDHDTVRKSNIDSSRYELKIEADAFFYPGDKSPTDIPTEAPQADANKVWTTLSPTTSPSSLPSDGPSMEPTEWDIERNGGCRNGLKLYEVHMMDSWGDGWDQTMITITGISDQNPLAGDLPTNSMTTTNTNTQGDMVVSISKTIEFDSIDSTVAHPNPENEIDPLGTIFQGGLTRGSHDFADVCLLPKRCYQLVATGGDFLDEVSWELRPRNKDPSSPPMEPLLAGGAPAGCTFSLPDEYGHHFCPNTCSDTLPTDAVVDLPEVMDNLQPNEDGMAAETLSEAVGRTHIIVSTGTLDGKTQETTTVTERMRSRTGGNGNTASTILNNFKLVDGDEHSSN